jgi:hypothetical protein
VFDILGVRAPAPRTAFSHTTGVVEVGRSRNRSDHQRLPQRRKNSGHVQSQDLHRLTRQMGCELQQEDCRTCYVWLSQTVSRRQLEAMRKVISKTHPKKDLALQRKKNSNYIKPTR